MKPAVAVVVVCGMLLFHVGCTKGPTEGERKALQLTAEDASCTEAYLRIETWTKPSVVVLQRNDSTIATLQLTTIDTLIVDEGLQPSHTYRYSVQLVSPIPPAWMDRTLRREAEIRTMDTTSHEVQWYIDTLGTEGLIRDVWIFDRNLAYAVGEIYKDYNKDYQIYNAAKWNGREWELMRVYFPTVCGSSSLAAYPAKAIFAFEDEIWISSSGDKIAILKNGIQVDKFCLPSEVSMSINKLWGTSSRDLYAVGNNGLIAHYDGVRWERIESGTTVDLDDIYGLDGNHIWVAGTMGDYSRSVILFYDGKRWNKLYEGSYHGFNSVWTNRKRSIYITGDSGPHRLTMKDLVFQKLTTPALYVMYCVRGLDYNDIFFTGQNSEVTHFNGSTYRLYRDIQGNINADTWWYSVKLTSDFVVIGGGYYTGYNFAPIIVRGYR